MSKRGAIMNVYNMQASVAQAGHLPRSKNAPPPLSPSLRGKCCARPSLTLPWGVATEQCCRVHCSEIIKYSTLSLEVPSIHIYLVRPHTQTHVICQNYIQFIHILVSLDIYSLDGSYDNNKKNLFFSEDVYDNK